MELGTEVLRRQLRAAFKLPGVAEARLYLDSLAIRSPALPHVRITSVTHDVTQSNFNGTWVAPRNTNPESLVLYLHGGGYSFYPRSSYNNMAALLALSTNSKLFMPDYHLSPVYKFPAQLQDAIHAYKWLLSEGTDPKKLVVLGDSAGGNLTLALLLSLRDAHLPLPALAVCFSPATDFQSPAAMLSTPTQLDWITQEMALQWADWFCTPAERSNPLVSPVLADLTHLPPIYIQAGGAEILLPGIQQFAKQAKLQGADVTLEIWPEMNHVFQAFGYDVPQSMAALKRVREVIALRMARTYKQPAIT